MRELGRQLGEIIPPTMHYFRESTPCPSNHILGPQGAPEGGGSRILRAWKQERSFYFRKGRNSIPKIDMSRSLVAVRCLFNQSTSIGLGSQRRRATVGIDTLHKMGHQPER